MKLNINDFPLIAITEVMDMESSDSGSTVMPDGKVVMTRTVEDLFPYKAGHLDKFPEYRDWGLDWKQERPVYIDHGPWGRTFRNGHHRATQAHRAGLLFIHYTDDYHVGWSQYDFD